MKELYKIAFEGARDVYCKTNPQIIDFGILEMWVRMHQFDGKLWNHISFRGTDELKEWGVRGNLCVTSWDGIKRTARKQALIALEYLKLSENLNPYNQILIDGHSAGAGYAVALNKIIKKRYPFLKAKCVGFNIPPVLRPWACEYDEDITLFIDPDDPVSKAFYGFRHPKCTIFKASNNHIGLDTGDHDINLWEKYINEM